MADKIRWGVISTSGIGRKRVAPAIQESRNGTVVAVSSRSLEQARAYAEELNAPKAYGSYEELIADPEIDAIYNPLPNSLHAEWSIRCAEAGKPVLCEKPLASNAPEAQKMVDAFARRNLLFAEAFMYRFHPQTQRVKAMIDDGAVGDVQILQSTFTFALRSETNIRLNKSLAGGSLMDVGCYCVNVMRLMTGEEPDKASALAHMGESSQVDETLVGILSFPSGAVGHFDCGLRTDRVHSYEIRGSRGRIVIEEAFTIGADSEPVIRYWHGDQYEEIQIEAANSYKLTVEDFADALLLGRPPRFAPQDGVANMEVVDRLLASLA